MKCWHCNNELIWGGDHDLEEEENEEYMMVTNLSCPECESFVLVYLPKKDSKKVDTIKENN
jgi:DNA-directed RNA polymerase subunit RPC12/RpoP